MLCAIVNRGFILAMPTLFPPEYPERPDAPLLGFGPSFSEEIARSLIAAVWHDNDEQPHESEVRVAAALTMLEAFHPRDHLECMLAAQGVACHAAIMHCFGRGMHRDTPEALAVKLRGNAVAMSRTFSTTLRDMERRQAKPLPQRPLGDASPSPVGPPADPVPSGSASGPPIMSGPPADDSLNLPEDLETRPDGTPGTLTAYAPKVPEEVFVLREAPINLALATRPKLWRQVNVPGGSAENKSPAASVAVESEPLLGSGRGPLNVMERTLTGDDVARFTSARFDPDAPVQPINFDHEDSIVELEVVSAGSDPDAEADRRALMAAHPEGKAIRILRYGGMAPPADPPDKS